MATKDEERTNEEKLRLAKEAASEEQYIVAGNLCKEVRDAGADDALLTEEHERWIVMAEKTEKVMEDLLKDPNESPDYWKKQCESHGHRDTMIHYHVDSENRLTCRVETPIESSLLLPIIAVFNETELFHTWMPNWSVPKVGIKESKKLGEYGRGHQLIYMYVQLPFPMHDREVYENVYAVDAIDSHNCIAIKALSSPVGSFDGLVKEPTTKKVRQLGLDAGFTIRPCPHDHHLLENSKAKYPEGEKLILLSLEQWVDPHVSFVPKTLQNFFTRNFMSTLWGRMLKLGEEVRENKRPEHAKAIAEKKELYDWVEARVQVMFDNMEEGAKQDGS